MIKTPITPIFVFCGGKSLPRTRIRNFCYTTMHVTSDKSVVVSHKKNNFLTTHCTSRYGWEQNLFNFFLFMDHKKVKNRICTYIPRKNEIKTYPVLFVR